MMEAIDPAKFQERLKDVPVYNLVSSDDEFAMFDWTDIFYDKLEGESHVYIVPNTEHTMLTGIYSVLTKIGTWCRSLAAGIKERPTFSYKYEASNGTITVTVPEGQVKPSKVLVRFGQTLSDKRRDFRWIVASDNGNCTWPLVAVKEDVSICLQPI